MRRIFYLFPVLLFLLACQAVTAFELHALPLPGNRQARATSSAVTPLAVLPVVPTPAPTTLAPSPAPSLSPTLTPTLQLPHGYMLRIHPEGNLFVGDQVSFELIAPATGAALSERASLKLAGPPAQPLGEQKFEPYGIGGRRQATFLWAWDTAALSPGSYELAFLLLPDGPVITQTLALLPATDLPASEAGAQWAEVRSQCCIVQYVTGTQAERDLPGLLASMDAQAADAARRMTISLTEPITVTLIPRVLGQGGFANGEIGISYLDRNYASGSLEMILHHEMIHILDERLGGDLRPSLLVEGLAVYMSGGHYKPEPLLPRAAALLDEWGSPSAQGLDLYIPLSNLIEQFYTAQHEVGYLEAGALIEYMVSRWGWQDFSSFYRDIHPHQSRSQVRAIDASLQQHLSLSLAELESDFIAALREQPVIPGWREDVRLTIELYDTLRRYQQALDPDAYFLNAWLLDTREMRRRKITADYLRHPSAPLNLEIETQLQAAGRALLAADYLQTANRIADANTLLDLNDK